MRTLYDILGVAKTASDKDIKAAYRKLAKEFHPDLNPGKKGIEEQFKEISAAYALLSDPEKRRRYDAGEIDASGQEQAPRGAYYRDFADGMGGAGFSAQEGSVSPEDLEEILSGLFGQKGGRGGARMKARGADVSYTLRISFLDAAKGATKSITMPDGRTLSLQIPEGARDRQTLRLTGQGGPGYGGGPAGDAFVELHIEPHPYFTRKDNDVHLELPISLKEAVLGAKVDVPTVHGPVTMNVPAGSNTGATMRLKDKGIYDPRAKTRGHQYVKLKVVLPKVVDPALQAFVESWTPKDDNPRSNMGGSA